MNMTMNRYNQVVGLMNEAIGLAPMYSREEARQWFKTKENMKDNGMIDRKAYIAFMRMARSCGGGFIKLECMQNNLALFISSVRAIEEQRPQTCNNRVIVESRNKVLDNLEFYRLITDRIRKAVEGVYSTT